MDDISATLIRLLASTLPGALAPGLAMAPAGGIVDSALAEALGAAEREPIVRALADVVGGRRDLVDGLGEAAAALEAARASVQPRAAMDARLESTRRALSVATALSAVLDGSIERAELQLAEPALFALVPQISLPAAAGEPEVHIIGAVAPTGDRPALRLGRRSPLDRIEIAYELSSPYPLLTLTSASRGEDVAWATSRSAWRQEPDLDLIIQNTAGSKNLGWVRTTLVTTSWAHHGVRLSISIPAIPGHSLVQTTISDAADRPLARVIRVYRA